MLQDFFDQFQTESLMSAKLDRATLQNSLILQIFFTVCEHKFVRLHHNCRSQIESNDIEEERKPCQFNSHYPAKKQRSFKRTWYNSATFAT